MPKIEALNVKSGVNSEDTDVAAGPIYVDADKVRFRHGKAEKIGGWEKLLATTFDGRCRKLLGWRDLSDNRNVGVSTNYKIYVLQGGTLTDVSPTRDSGSLGTDPFAVVDQSTTVTVTDTSHGLLTGDFVSFSGATAGGGITIDGEYQVTNVEDANTYTITHSSAATSTDATTGGASVTYVYYWTTGPETTIQDFGWSAGTYSRDGYSDTASTSNLVYDLGTTSLDLWGEDLVITPWRGSTYLWDASVGTGTRAAVISQVPTALMTAVTDDRHMMAFGAYDGTAIDPMLIRWSDREDYTDWTPTATNLSGDYRLQEGTQIVAHIRSGGQILVWTNTALYGAQSIGSPFVFGLIPYGQTVDIVGPNAVAEWNGVAYWMGTEGFYKYDGNIHYIPCPVRNKVFDDFDIGQRRMVNAGFNSAFNEVWFWYPSNGSTTNDKYVAYNVVDDTWTIGTMARTAWLRLGTTPTPYPLAAGEDGYLYQHEFGYNADGAAISAYIETSDFQVDNGDQFLYSGKYIPDIKDQVGTLNLTVKTKRYPHDQNEISKGPYAMLPSTEKVNFRARGRTMALRFSSDAVNDKWRLGLHRLELNLDGRR